MQTQILQGFTLFGILTQRFFNHYRNNELYIGAKRNSINTFTLTFHPHFVNKVFTESSNIFENKKFLFWKKLLNFIQKRI